MRQDGADEVPLAAVEMDADDLGGERLKVVPVASRGGERGHAALSSSS